LNSQEEKGMSMSLVFFDDVGLVTSKINRTVLTVGFGSYALKNLSHNRTASNVETSIVIVKVSPVQEWLKILHNSPEILSTFNAVIVIARYVQLPFRRFRGHLLCLFHNTQPVVTHKLNSTFKWVHPRLPNGAAAVEVLTFTDFVPIAVLLFTIRYQNEPESAFKKAAARICNICCSRSMENTMAAASWSKETGPLRLRSIRRYMWRCS
jgi:hypothetical protein